MESFNVPPSPPSDGSLEHIDLNEQLRFSEAELKRLKAIPPDQFSDLDGQDVQFHNEKIERIKWSLKNKGSSN